MALVNQPAILSGAFAAEGDKNTIPANNDGLSGLASIAKGFPPITQVPLAQGGLPPQRQDFNGIFNLFSQFLLYAQNGGVYAYNNTLDYQPPAIIASDNVFYQCVAENGPSTSAGVQPVTNTDYWKKLVLDVAVMQGASASAAGATGLVPAPAAGAQNKFLRGDGTWADAKMSTKELVDILYPVGHIYMSTNSTNPGTLFPGTTWEAYAQGRVLIGAGTGTDSRSERKTFAAGSTGGEYNHQLTVGELATHSHTGSATSASLTGTLNIPNGAAKSSPVYYAATGIISASGYATEYGNANGGGAGGRVTVNATHSHNLTINNIGDNTAHNNIQPYIAVYIWRRTA